MLVDTRCHLARIFHELPAATVYLTVLPGVLGCRTLRRTVQVRLESNSLRLPYITAISTVSRQQATREISGLDFDYFTAARKLFKLPKVDGETTSERNE
jgi:hypothetical protein